MLKILWKRREIAPLEQLLLLSTIFSYLMLDFYVKTRIKFSLRDKRLFKITEVEITRVDCNPIYYSCYPSYFKRSLTSVLSPLANLHFSPCKKILRADEWPIQISRVEEVNKKYLQGKSGTNKKCQILKSENMFCLVSSNCSIK